MELFPLPALRHQAPPTCQTIAMDEFGTAFDIFQALDCKKVGLVTARHSELRYGLSDLAIKAFNPTHVHDDLKTYTGRAVLGGKVKLNGSPSKDKGELKGGILIKDLWTQGTDSIQDMHVINTDATSYQSKNPEKCLGTAEKGKKKNYLKDCLKRRRHFTPFVASLGGLIGVEG